MISIIGTCNLMPKITSKVSPMQASMDLEITSLKATIGVIAIRVNKFLFYSALKGAK